MSLKPWRNPSSAEASASNVDRFRRFVNTRHNIALPDYWALHEWSVTPGCTSQFWDAIWDFCNMIGDRGKGPIFDDSKPMWPSRHLNPTVRMSWAENVLRSHKHAKSMSRAAVIATIEPADLAAYENLTAAEKHKATYIRTLTYSDLEREVCYASEALRAFGIRKGDAVAGYVSNNAEAVVMVLAANTVGAIWSSSAPEVKPPAVMDRFGQLKPKILIVVDRYRQAGTVNLMASANRELVAGLTPLGLQQVIVVGQLTADREPKQVPHFSGAKAFSWRQFLSEGKKSAGGRIEPRFERMEMNTPLWVLYSSGTTGKPKAIVHSQGGMLLGPTVNNVIHHALHDRSVMLQAATTSWMMWNALVSGLGSGSTIITYDGSPLHPRSILWDFTEQHGITWLGLSPRYLQIMQSSNYVIKDRHDVTKLETILTAGSPLSPQLYDFVRDAIKHLYLENGSGGTDICAAFVGGCPTLPIYHAEIQVPVLGMAVKSYSTEGKPAPPGDPGDLVVVRAFPNMPRSFLGPTEEEGELMYKAAYYDFYPPNSEDQGTGRIWRHGDLIQITDRGGTLMLGRSDGVLNPGGVRFGSAEIYAVIEQMKDEIDDSLAVGQKLPDGDERVVLFVAPLAGRQLDGGMRERIAKRVAANLSKRHVPALMVECRELPYTSSMKRLEVPVKKIINGTPLSKISTAGVLNPDSLKFFVDNPVLRLAKAKL